MLCPECQNTVDPGAAFCGTCGFELPPASAQTSFAPTGPNEQATSEPLPPQQSTAPFPADHSGKAIASFVIGVLGIPGCLIPVVGTVFGILAIVFGTLSIHSVRRVFAIIGMSFGTVVLLGSLFLWVHNTQELVKQQRQGKAFSSPVAGQQQTITTPCYTTKVPASLTLTMTNGSCTFLAADVATGEQQEVKVIQVPGLTAANLSTAATTDAKNVVGAIPGGSITRQASATFSGSQAYEIELQATDGSAGTISYIYGRTVQGNLVIILHTQARASGTNYDLSTIEANWAWQ